MTLGRAIRTKREALGLQQKQLCTAVFMNTGKPMSAQYLNDVEHDRRHLPIYVLGQIGLALSIPFVYLCWLQGEFPDFMHDHDYAVERIERAFEAFAHEFERGGIGQ